MPLRGDVFDPAVLPTKLRMSRPVRDMRCVHRFRNPDLWGALLPPILHQRRRALDAARMYRSLCEAHGPQVSTEAGPALLAPRPDTVAGLSDSAFNAIGLRGKAAPLRKIASAYMDRATSWSGLSHGELYTELLAVPGVGKWTAGIAIADVTNDFSFYAFSGLSTFTRWQEMFSAIESGLTADEFKRTLERLNRHQLSTFVLLALASSSTTRGRG